MVVTHNLRRVGVAIAGGVAIAAIVAACAKIEDEPEGSRPAPTADEARAVAAEGIVAADPDPGGFGTAAQDPGSAEAPNGPTTEIDRETYTVRVAAPSEASHGDSSVAEIHVVPKEGWRMNHDFPMKLAVHPVQGVEIEGAEQVIEDAVHYSDERGEWAVRFTPDSEGETTIEADFRFAVCTDEVCIPKREKLAWSVEVD